MFIRILLAALAGALSFAQQQETAPAIPPLLDSANASYMKGDYEAARQSLLQSWDLAQQSPPEDPVRYDILKRLTSARTAAGEFADADNFLQMAIAWRESTVGKDDPKIADDLLLDVGLCRGMKDYPRALIVLGRVLSMHSRASGFDSRTVADDFSRMAQIYMEQKKMVEAVTALNTALEIRTRLGGPLDYSLLGDLDRLGEIYIAQREYEKAEADYRHALVIRETIYGKEHADLIATIDGLAYACFGQKKYDLAEPLYQRLIGLWIKSTGDDHPMVAIALDKVSVFYAEQKKFDQAQEAADRANAIRTHFLGDGLSHQATEAFAAGDKPLVTALYQRELKVLDPPNPLYDDLRAEAEGMLKALARLEPKKSAPKNAAPKIAPKKP